MRQLRVAALLLIGLLAALLAARMPVAAQTPQRTVSLAYLALKPPRTPSTALVSVPADQGIQGARLALGEAIATGRFLGIGYDMQESVVADEAAVLDAGRAAIAAGRRLLVADLPAAILLHLADLPEAHNAVILDIGTGDDALRGADCRANVLHVAPSYAMLTDALMQFLVTSNWRHIMLLTGKAAADHSYAEAVRRSAKKFQIKIDNDRDWSFNPAAQQADTGHYQINTEVADATRGASYDVLVVADVSGVFGNSLAYRTSLPRPIAGTQGLTPTTWSPIYDEYAGAQLQLRFRQKAKRPMIARDYDAWVAVQAISEAAVRSGKTEPDDLATFMRGPGLEVASYKGTAMSFRPWDGQLRQPILLADQTSLVNIAPLPGFLHQYNTLDTLGTDQPETTCHMP
jgi:ABC transporter substrate binding protein (PQQ-dependent alcohol dehydrogenase system)